MKMSSAFSNVAIASLALIFSAVPSAQQPDAPQAGPSGVCLQDDFGSGTIIATGTAPGKDPSVEVTKGASGEPGKITVTSVWINGQKVDKDKYTIREQGSVSPEIIFHEPDPGAPAQGAVVNVYGTTENGDKKFDGKLKWK